MSQQAVNTPFDRDDRSDEQIARGVAPPKAHTGELVVGVRVDTPPEIETERLAGNEKFHPLTTDEKGQLRAVLPDGIEVETGALGLLTEIRDLLIDCRDLLMKIA